MKRSQIALLGAAVVILIGIVIVVAGLRVWFSHFAANVDRAPEATLGATPARLTDLPAFTGILIRDNWDVHVGRGDAQHVELSVRPDDRDDLHVQVEDGRLVLSGTPQHDRWWRRWGGSSRRYRAEIVVPQLDSIEVQGGANVVLRDFDGDRLTILAAGAVNLHGYDSRFEHLSLTLSGAGNVDFSDVPVVDAQIAISGAGNIVLAMNGGRLTGTLSGLGNVTYSGPVSLEAVNVSGLGRVGTRAQ